MEGLSPSPISSNSILIKKGISWDIAYSIGAGGRKSRPQTRIGRMKEASKNKRRESKI